MNDPEYHQIVDALFLKIETWIENSQQDIDFDLEEGMLTINLNQNDSLLLSKQASLKEVWLASKVGAYHFKLIEGKWLTQQKEDLFEVIVQCAKKSGFMLEQFHEE